MSLMGRFPDGYYDNHGEWQRTKFCFVSCGSNCTCMPPMGQFYSKAHDKRLTNQTEKLDDDESTNHEHS
jgi:hypothetical protein